MCLLSICIWIKIENLVQNRYFGINAERDNNFGLLNMFSRNQQQSLKGQKCVRRAIKSRSAFYCPNWCVQERESKTCNQCFYLKYDWNERWRFKHGFQIPKVRINMKNVRNFLFWLLVFEIYDQIASLLSKKRPTMPTIQNTPSDQIRKHLKIITILCIFYVF